MRKTAVIGLCKLLIVGRIKSADLVSKLVQLWYNPIVGEFFTSIFELSFAYSRLALYLFEPNPLMVIGHHKRQLPFSLLLWWRFAQPLYFWSAGHQWWLLQAAAMVAISQTAAVHTNSLSKTTFFYFQVPKIVEIVTKSSVYSVWQPK